MTVLELVSLWQKHPYFDEAIRQELNNLQATDLEDRFYRYMEFGTGGLRGLLGAGTNRMNRYTVRHATQGLADYISTFGQKAKERGVVIAYDSRHFSPVFAEEAALTLNANGVVAYLWDSLRPTPMLSFAVRELNAIAGIVITASHNPPQYNGYKVYWEDGGQVPPERAKAIQKAIGDIAEITLITPMEAMEARERGLLRSVPEVIDRTYIGRLLSLARTQSQVRENCKILYSPLHGAGNIPVREVLSQAGYQVTVVPEQELPDPDFSTVHYPNPEEPEVFTLALRYAKAQQPDVIMATDPDADRLGVLVRLEDGDYKLLSGNQIGAILVDFILSSRKAEGTLPANAAVVKTIATSNMISTLCANLGVALLDTHTGFKFIGDKIREFEETQAYTFLFGYEESYGYLGADFVRDKDAVMAALLVAEATAYYKERGLTLYGALQRLWGQCGHFLEDLYSVSLPGQQGQEKIAVMMATLRSNLPRRFGGVLVAFVDDYLAGTGVETTTGKAYPLRLDVANVIHYRFADGGFVMVRPSGTEPKLKIYFSVKGCDEDEAEGKLAAVRDDVLRTMGLM